MKKNYELVFKNVLNNDQLKEIEAVLEIQETRYREKKSVIINYEGYYGDYLIEFICNKKIITSIIIELDI